MAISLLAALLLLVGLESLSVHAGGQTYNLQVPSGLEQPLNPGIPQSLMLGSQFQVEFTSNQHFRIRDVLSGNTVLEPLSVNSPIISVQKRSSPLKISIKNGNAKAPEVCSLDPYFDKISLDYIGKGSTSSSSRGDDGSVIIINGDLICGRCGFRQTPIDFSLTLSLSPSKKHLEFDLKISNEYSFDLNNSVVSLNFASPRDERIFGLGKQYSYFNLKGKKVPVLVREGGIGRGKQPYTSALNSLSGEYAGGDEFTSYAPVPYFITSKFRGIYLRNTEYSVFDLKKDSVTISIANGGRRIRGGILSGKDSYYPLLEEYTQSVSGRMKPLPEWMGQGIVLGVQGGEAVVRDIVNSSIKHDMKIAGIWMQDWCGERSQSIFGKIYKRLWWNWEPDTILYPGWSNLVKFFKDINIKTLAYVNPFLSDVSSKPGFIKNYFKEAEEKGFLVKRKSDKSTYIINSGSSSFSAGLIDLANPSAFEWYKSVLKQHLLSDEYGVDGYMADFAETLPFDSYINDGATDPSEFHNSYAVEWARLNHELVGDSAVVPFHRSAFTTSPKYAKAFWEGDQLPTWDREDGLKSAVIGMLSGGVSGMTISHSDIGGYTFAILPETMRSRELLIRWLEMSTFTSILRTHEGSNPALNAQFYDDEESFATFAKFSKLFASLAPYRNLVMKEAHESGYPVARHPILEFPTDSKLLELHHEEFLLGSHLLVAPVQDSNVDRLKVYLPILPSGQEAWRHVWSGIIFEGGGDVRVNAPIGRPPVFLRLSDASNPSSFHPLLTKFVEEVTATVM